MTARFAIGVVGALLAMGIFFGTLISVIIDDNSVLENRQRDCVAVGNSFVYDEAAGDYECIVPNVVE